MLRPPRRCLMTLKLLSIALTILLSIPAPTRAAELPTALSDEEFWRIVTEFSEASGVFQPQLMTNEDSLQSVIPALKQMTRRGGVYVGVGTEQNFTYIAAIQPRIAFVVDIRRDNLLEHLMYKALFELSTDRADFVSRLFSRKRPSGLNARSSVAALFEAYRSVAADRAFQEENVRAVLDQITSKHKFLLSETERGAIASFLSAFYAAGPFALKGTGDKNLSYAQSMTGTDLTGHSQSYLASEDSFELVRDLEKRNLVVPLAGDFAGQKAIVSIGRFLRDRGAVVDVFYLSNVERYLWEQGDHGRQFYANAESLPLTPSSTFIRSVTVDISRRLGISVPDSYANWRSFLSPMREFLTAFAQGRIQSYREVFDYSGPR